MKTMKLVKYKIKDQDLLRQVLTHKSWTKSGTNNERLEFLGDAVLSLIIADLLMKKYPGVDEGELTKKRSRLVSGHSLAKLAIKLGFPDDLKTGVKSYKNNYRILAGALEAYIGAIYLENKFSLVKKRIEILFRDIIDQDLPELNYKSLLQEWCQKKYKELPVYKLKKEEGLEHKKTFFVEVFIKGADYGTGSSHQKKQAEQKAAQQALKKLKILLK